ncbi:MAG: DUF58 domain-containing protein [Spirochaetales bacterium]|nr:DUF58 domain-containing protein [Spirochaetales bacterium]
MDSVFLTKIKKIELIAVKLVETLISGNYRSVFHGQGMEFNEVREYMYGDDIRMIDWNVTSRMGSPYTKTFREERELVLFSIIDISSSMFFGSGPVNKHEVIALAFTVLGLAAVYNNDKIGTVFFSDTIEKWVAPGKGKKHVLSLINDLFSFKPEGKGSNLKLALQTVYQYLKKRSICVILSDFKTDNYWNQMSLLSQKHDVIAVKIIDDNDLDFPKTGFIPLKDPETGKVLFSHGRSGKFRTNYRQKRNAEHDRWKHMCLKYGAAPLVINTKDDVGLKLYQFFEKRKRA